MNSLVFQLVTTFHHAVNELYSIDVTVARAKSMLALASLTWPGLGIVATPHFITASRLTWKSEAFDSVSMGGSFRRDPVGDDASIIIDDDATDNLVMQAEMHACAEFIPMFGRQKLEHFNLILAELWALKSGNVLLLPSGSDSRHTVCSEEEYVRFRDWLVEHGAVTPEGEWVTAPAGS